jgi:hypothetical protein
MVPVIHKTVVLLSVMILSAVTLQLSAQTPSEAEDYITVSGTVKNQQNHKAVEFVSVALKGTNVGTVTNEDGEFTLKIKKSIADKTIIVSHIGYGSIRQQLPDKDVSGLTLFITPQKNLLNEVVVEARVSRNIVHEAISRIPDNYEQQPTLLTGFYRETARKRSHYISISEAVVNLYKTAYKERSANRDRVQIIKGRKLMSEKSGDTLGVKLIGGPSLSLYMDVVKNPGDLLNETTLGYYEFKMEKSAFIDLRQQYIISFKPVVSVDNALFFGKLYIDKNSFAITRMELSLDMSDRDKVTQSILQRKPFGLIFKPQQLTFLINYKERNGKMCLSYIRNEVQFKCDWNRRLFHTEYGVVSEMVVTDLVDNGVQKIPYKESFHDSDAFEDKVSAFYDDDFWGSYNILAPTESLDKAVSKLKKQHKEK